MKHGVNTSVHTAYNNVGETHQVGAIEGGPRGFFAFDTIPTNKDIERGPTEYAELARSVFPNKTQIETTQTLDPEISRVHLIRLMKEAGQLPPQQDQFTNEELTAAVEKAISEFVTFYLADLAFFDYCFLLFFTKAWRRGSRGAEQRCF